MPKFTMPTIADFNQHFLAKKTIFGPKKDPVWVYLEREMLQNIENKPYNEKVGEWLKFLKDLKYYFYRESKKQKRILLEEIGPLWYVEMSLLQKEVLRNLAQDIHRDLLEDLPHRTRKSLSNLGINRSIPKPLLMQAMVEAGGDPAVFIWKLYTAIYKKTPSEPRGEYDMDARILMSALVFIDLEECSQNLEELTKPVKETHEPEQKKKVKKYTEPKCRYGMYLQRNYVPLYCRHPSPQRGKRMRSPPPPMEKKFAIRSDDSYERLRMDHSFLEKRMQRCKMAQPAQRICTYKFWEPPLHLLNSGDPQQAAYCRALKMYQQKAKVCHESGIENIQFNVGPVVFAGGRPRYLLNNICVLPTGYITIHGGTVLHTSGEYLTNIAGAWRYPIEKIEKCDVTCDCLQKWEPAVLNYLEGSKCKCGHLYDFYHEGKCREKYFYPPTPNLPMWFDYAKIFQLDPTEDFIKETVRLAVTSEEPAPEPSCPGLSTSGVSIKALLQSLLADLSHTALVIPHLPQAFLLNNLREWVRKRFKGNLTPTEHKQSMLRSLRRWLWLSHMDFKARAYMIPFTREETDNVTWEYRKNLQELYITLLRDFTTRNRLRQAEQTRLWWSTMVFDRYPSQAFLDVFFTYMPGRMKDTYVLNPHNADATLNRTIKPCPLT